MVTRRGERAGTAEAAVLPRLLITQRAIHTRHVPAVDSGDETAADWPNCSPRGGVADRSWLPTLACTLRSMRPTRLGGITMGAAVVRTDARKELGISAGVAGQARIAQRT